VWDIGVIFDCQVEEFFEEFLGLGNDFFEGCAFACDCQVGNEPIVHLGFAVQNENNGVGVRFHTQYYIHIKSKTPNDFWHIDIFNFL